MKKPDHIEFDSHARYLAEKFALMPGTVKLCLRGPQTNVERGSIEGITTPADAQRMLKKAKSRERCRAIVRRWIEVCREDRPAGDLRQVFDTRQSSSLFDDTDLRFLWYEKWRTILENMLAENHFGALVEFYRWCPGSFHSLRDKVFMHLLATCDSFEGALLLVELFDKAVATGHTFTEDCPWNYWTALGKAAVLAPSKREVEDLIKQVVAKGVFDPEQHACQLLLLKATMYRGF